MSWLFSIHNTHPFNLPGILTKSHALPTTIIPEFKQSKNDQKSLCVNKRLTPWLHYRHLHYTQHCMNADKLGYLVAMANINCVEIDKLS